jgi:hypothetical protein
MPSEEEITLLPSTVSATRWAVEECFQSAAHSHDTSPSTYCSEAEGPTEL